jgi:hypothetical protein
MKWIYMWRRILSSTLCIIVQPEPGLSHLESYNFCSSNSGCDVYRMVRRCKELQQFEVWRFWHVNRIKALKAVDSFPHYHHFVTTSHSTCEKVEKFWFLLLWGSHGCSIHSVWAAWTGKANALVPSACDEWCLGELHWKLHEECSQFLWVSTV